MGEQQASGLLYVAPAIVIAVIAASGALIAVGKWIGSVNSDRTSFKEFMGEVRTDLDRIKSSVDRILGRLGEMGEPILERGSPLRLTSFGQTLAAELGAQEWADRIADDLAKKAAEADSEPYQIDQECERYVHSHLDAAMTANVGRVGFERGVKTNDLLAALHIVLRDVVLERVKNYRS